MPDGTPAMPTLESPAQLVAQGKACLAGKISGFVIVCRRLLLLTGKPEADDASRPIGSSGDAPSR
jgi:hypothetical protein